MPGKKKRYSKVTAVKDAARATIGAPKPAQVIPDAKRKAESSGGKHKKSARERMEEE